MWDRKVYDREHSRKKYKEYIERRNNVIKSGKIGDTCYLCGAKAKREFHFHHIAYDKNESNYPRTVSGWSRWKRVREKEER